MVPNTVSLACFAALLASPLATNAHYIFSQLIVNGSPLGGDFDYIRENSNSYMPSYAADIIPSNDLRCNTGATAGDGTGVADVSAGDVVGFKLWYNEFIEHPGPGFVYMSLAPSGDVASYEGDGDWFKVWESGMNGPAADEGSWGTWQDDRIEFTIPADLPSGEYLVRPEHIAIHEGHVGKAQFYMECAQLRVSGGGNGSPGPMVQIPGLYSVDDAGIAFSMWNGATTYEMPGPAVWEGGDSGNVATTPTGTTEEETSYSVPAEAEYSAPAEPAYSAPPEYSAPAPATSSAAPVWSDNSASNGSGCGVSYVWRA